MGIPGDQLPLAPSQTHSPLLRHQPRTSATERQGWKDPGNYLVQPSQCTGEESKKGACPRSYKVTLEAEPRIKLKPPVLNEDSAYNTLRPSEKPLFRLNCRPNQNSPKKELGQPFLWRRAVRWHHGVLRAIIVEISLNRDLSRHDSFRSSLSAVDAALCRAKGQTA